MKPRDKTAVKKQVTEGIDQEKAQKRGEKEPKLVRKAVTAAVAQPPPAKRNQLLEKATSSLKKVRHITPAMHQAPCSSATAMYRARSHGAVALMVIDVFI